MSELTNADLYANSRFLDLYIELKAKKILKKKRELTDSVGMPQEYFSRIENNAITIPSHFIDKLVDLYQLPPDYFSMPESKEPGNNINVTGNNTVKGIKYSNQVGTAVRSDNEMLNYLRKEIQEKKDELKECRDLLKSKDEELRRKQERIEQLLTQSKL